MVTTNSHKESNNGSGLAPTLTSLHQQAQQQLPSGMAAATTNITDLHKNAMQIKKISFNSKTQPMTNE